MWDKAYTTKQKSLAPTIPHFGCISFIKENNLLFRIEKLSLWIQEGVVKLKPSISTNTSKF